MYDKEYVPPPFGDFSIIKRSATLVPLPLTLPSLAPMGCGMVRCGWYQLQLTSIFYRTYVEVDGEIYSVVWTVTRWGHMFVMGQCTKLGGEIYMHI